MGWSLWPRSKPEEKPAAPPAPVQTGQKKICCACPDTKRLRDECVTLHGLEAAECQRLIEAHKECLRAEGFRVRRPLLPDLASFQV